MIVPSRLPRIALLLLFTVPASGGERPAAHLVELPAPETAARLERCLAASGFDVTRRETPGAEIRIDAMRGEEVRGLLVSPVLPLASVVEWGPNAGEAHAPGTPDDLRACIDRGEPRRRSSRGRNSWSAFGRAARAGDPLFRSPDRHGGHDRFHRARPRSGRGGLGPPARRQNRARHDREKRSLAGPVPDRPRGTGSRISP